LAISDRWLRELDLGQLTTARLTDLGRRNVDVDVVAIGKASREMSDAVDVALGARVRRRLIVCDHTSASVGTMASDTVVGDHPIPEEGSWRAGERLISFLDESTR